MLSSVQSHLLDRTTLFPSMGFEPRLAPLQITFEAALTPGIYSDIPIKGLSLFNLGCQDCGFKSYSEYCCERLQSLLRGRFDSEYLNDFVGGEVPIETIKKLEKAGSGVGLKAQFNHIL